MMRLSLHLLLLFMIIQWYKITADENSSEEKEKGADEKKKWQEKYPDFCVGCHVRLSNDKELVIKLQKGHGEWEKSMKKVLGKVGKIESVDSDGDVEVRFDGYENGDTVLLNPDAITFVPQEEIFCKGCQVRLRENAELVEEKQKLKKLDHKIDSELLGETGKVVSVTREGDVVIDFEDRDVPEMTFNPVLLLPVNNAFCVGCNVTFNADKESYVRRKQKGHGEWKDEMKEVFGKVGVVQGTDSDGDVQVTFEGNLTFTLNPELLTLEEDEEDSKFCQGCIVKLSDDQDFVIKEMDGHGEWVRSIEKVLGKTGKVDSSEPDGDVIVNFNQYGAEKTYIFAPSVLSSVKEEEEWDEPKPDFPARIHHSKSFVMCSRFTHNLPWINTFEKVLGKIGIVENYDNSTYLVEMRFDDITEVITFHTDVVQPLTTEEAFCEGCTARLHPDLDYIRKKTGLNRNQVILYKKLLGRSGVILKSFSDGRIAIKFVERKLPMLWDHTVLIPVLENVCDGPCVVKMSRDKELVQKRQISHGGWDDRMSNFLGTSGVFIATDTEADAIVVFNYTSGAYNPEILTVFPKDRKLCDTCLVQVHPDKYYVKEKQAKFGGCPKNMEKLVGAVGRVVQTDSDGGVFVEFPWFKTSFRFNPQLLTRTSYGEIFYKRSTVELHSDVFYVIQKQGSIKNGWKNDMEKFLGMNGTVDYRNGSVIMVKFIDDHVYPFHPDTLRPIPVDVENLNFWTECRVILSDDLDYIKPKMEQLFLWNEGIKKVLGKTGIVLPTKNVGYVEMIKFRELSYPIAIVPEALRNATEPVITDLEDQSLDFCVGCRVRLNADEKLVRKTMGKSWKAAMIGGVGRVGRVMAHNGEGLAQVHFAGLVLKDFHYEPSLLTRAADN